MRKWSETLLKTSFKRAVFNETRLLFDIYLLGIKANFWGKSLTDFLLGGYF
ncbi:hypothetical protein [Helicobacter pylori]|uniref:hypothetical protein n=1 Tax=Helicobacter pylori TaxID=210 RepID=UPI00165B94E3|nr:hypothetical protein [Helicobacter pylori]